jgi:predicted glycogen debranching enzyme
MHIEFSRGELQSFEAGLQREWLLTNGIGGYASGTVNCVNTRRYHGLLVAATQPPMGRVALLLRLNEAVTIDGDTTELTAAEYGDGTVFPADLGHLESFTLEDGSPVWSYAVSGQLIRRKIWMVPGHNVTVVRYRLVVGSSPVRLAIRPLCASRDHHALQHGSLDWRFSVEPVEAGIRVQADPTAAPLWLTCGGAAFLPGGDWYWRFLLREERLRGYDHVEDLYQPGTFHAMLEPGDALTLIASADDPANGLPDPDAALAAIRTAGTRNRKNHQRHAADDEERLAEIADALAEASQRFVTHAGAASAGGDYTATIAGYHWGEDWGRDAAASLPGLLLATGRLRDAESLLRHLASQIDQGMIPGSSGELERSPVYDSADAVFWFFRAMREALDAGVDESVLTDLYPVLKDVVDWHVRGTRFGIEVDPCDGLLKAGVAAPRERPTHLTWMNAAFRNVVYTPRIGKPVELNALWIDALDAMAVWSERCGDDPRPFKQRADRAAHAFAKRFWFRDGGYLFDVVDGPGGNDASIRPNQLVALVTFRSLVSETCARRVVERVTADLLTPFGLRTLAPTDPRYVGTYEGDQPARDGAYHQGTVWPWLLGPYAQALLRTGSDPQAVSALLLPFHEHLRCAGIGCVSEVFNGDAPHHPSGLIHHAWGVAELLRINGLVARAR